MLLLWLLRKMPEKGTLFVYFGIQSREKHAKITIREMSESNAIRTHAAALKLLTSTMFNYQNFDDVFAFDIDCYYDDAACRDVEVHRKKLEGLFIDRVMKLMGIKRRE